MHPVAILFGAACVGCIALSWRGGADAWLLSWLMLALWAGANLLWLSEHLALLPLFDLPVVMLAYAMTCARPTGWRVAVSVAFAFRLAMHMPGEWGWMPRVLYLHWINAAFLGALVAISWEGGARCVRDIIRGIRGIRRFRDMVASTSQASAS